MALKRAIWYANIDGVGIVLVRATDSEDARNRVDEVLMEEDLCNEHFEVIQWTEGEGDILVTSEE